MGLSVGIVGLPNVGKSTLFNALLKKQQAYVANFPFATIEPNIGVVPVPEKRLSKLAEVIGNNPPEVPATVEFVDIAGLIVGAHKGEGLGNKFLSHIRETDAICHVVRAFNDQEIIREGSADPASDFSVIETELMMSDLATLEKQREPKGIAPKEDKTRWSVVTKYRESIAKGIPVRKVELTEEEMKQSRQLGLLTIKPILIALNTGEEDLKSATDLEIKYASQFGVSVDQVIVICARLEEQLAGLPDDEQREYLKDLGLEKSGLERLINKAFTTLGLMTFLTAGEKEVRAWTIKSGTRVQDAAGVIHNDFVKKFIKADIAAFEDFVTLGGWKKCREEGKVRSEGRDYIMQDSEVVEFKIGA